VPTLLDEGRESDPVTIRWDVNASADGVAVSCTKLKFPVAPGELDRLVQDSRPATFGRGGQDVYDKSYREALQTGPDAFCSTFEPYSLGIIDTMAQVLPPSVLDSRTHRGVQAELCKLNVSSNPSTRQGNL
jgi:hypothetical protein